MGLRWQTPTPGGGGSVDVGPNKDGLPGGEAMVQLVGGLMFWALLACVAAVILGAAAWAWSGFSGNYHAAYFGRRTVLIGFGAGLVIGAASAIVAFAFNAGQNV